MTLPRFPVPHNRPLNPLEAYLIDLTEALDRELTDLRRAAGKAKYDPTNVTTSRAFDASAATLAQTRDVLGTLIVDLKGRGVVG